MAQMIPNVPRPFYKSSQEGLMFRTLSRLEDDYIVVHSVNFDYWGKRYSTEYCDALHQHQADFIIFHPQKGILVIEGKASAIKYENGKWYQQDRSAKTETYNLISPFTQASDIKYDLINAFKQNNLESLIKKCKFQHAVWFIETTKDDLYTKVPSTEINRKRILTYDSLENIQEEIERMYSLPIDIESQNDFSLKTDLEDNDIKNIKERIFNPMIVFSASLKTKIGLEGKILEELTNEQKNILNYLEEQRSAIITGVAGTGKTSIALEKALRHSENNEDVLFLCYNSRLCRTLTETYARNESMKHVKFKTIDSLSHDFCGKIDYAGLWEELYKIRNRFPYKHIIIDEGQDFGKRYGKNDDISYEKNICDVIDLLSEIVTKTEDNGTFYMFYDKYQLVNCNEIPSYIKDADCKLTLYVNCRNTDSISKTSTATLNLKNRKVKNYLEGEKPVIYNSTENEDKQLECLNSILTQCIKDNLGINDIQILTCKTIDKSFLNKIRKIDKTEEDIYKYNFHNKNFDVTTCRKFKGEEAKVIILLDVTKESFITPIGKALFYVGASRAKNRLFIVSKISNYDYKEIATAFKENIVPGRNPRTFLQNFLDVNFI